MHFALQYKQMLVYYPSPQPLPLSQRKALRVQAVPGILQVQEHSQTKIANTPASMGLTVSCRKRNG